MKSSKTMYDIVHTEAVIKVPRRHEGLLGYAIDMVEVNRIFFDNKFSSARNTQERYISEWIAFGMARYDSTHDVLWIIDPKMKPYLIAEKKAHPEDCKELKVIE